MLAPPRRPRVGIDFHVVDGKFQGSRSHVIELFSRVIEQRPEWDFFLFLDNVELLGNLSPAFRSQNVYTVRMPTTNPFKRLLWQLPRLARQNRLDILHTQYILPPWLPCAGMVTIHDILFETHPQYFERFFRLRSHILMRLSARRAARVFTVSEYSKQQLMLRYGLPEYKITVVHNGVDTDKFLPLQGQDDTAFLQRRGLRSGQYILSVGRLEPRKNQANLIRAYSQLNRFDIPLVIVGQRDFGYHEALNLIENLSLHDQVKIMDDVGDDELPIMYRNALVFAYPSYAEGFGIPPLEAMACGVPVITSNTTATPEVTAESACLVDPDNVAMLAQQINCLISDPGLAQKLRARALERSRKFDWGTAAAIVANGYQTLV